MPPRVDHDLDEVVAIWRKELRKLNTVKIGIRVAFKNAFDRVLDVAVSGAPARGRSFVVDRAGVAGSETEAGEDALRNVVDERSVEAPADNLAGIGQRADGGGADDDPYRGFRAGRRGVDQNDHRCHQQGREGREATYIWSRQHRARVR